VISCLPGVPGALPGGRGGGPAEEISMIPFIPIVLGLIFGGSGTGLVWYFALSDEDKKRADRKAAELAEQVYGKAIGELEERQKEDIHNRVKVFFHN
jgi:hypothetical protein